MAARRAKDSKQATETLQEIEGGFDRVAEWATQNPGSVLGGLAAILLVAAGVGLWDWQAGRAKDRAAAAVAEVQTSYLRAMGAAAGSFEVVEPANPETGRQVRKEYVDRFLAVADEHAGTAPAVSALMEAGTLLDQAGAGDAALDAWRRAAKEAPGGSALRGLALGRLARALESRGRWAEAGAAHAEAGAIEDLPTRSLSLADAARSYAEAGDLERALELRDALELLEDAPAPPDHVRARLDQLQATRSDATAP